MNKKRLEKRIENLNDLLVAGDPLDFIMKVASDENRGRDNPDNIKSAALELILADEDDLAFFAIDACAVRMHLSSSFEKIISRLNRKNSDEVLFSMISGIGVLGRRNIVEKQAAVSALQEIRKLATAKSNNKSTLENCDKFLAELSVNQKW